MPQTLFDVRSDPFAEPHPDGGCPLADKCAEAVLETPAEGLIIHHYTPDARELHLLDPIDAKYPQALRSFIVRIQV